MSFTASIIVGVSDTPSQIIITDNHTGSDTNLTSRQISLFQADGSLLVPVITWPIAQNSITLPILAQDVTLNISVHFVSSDPLPPPSVYTATDVVAFNGYAWAFLYYLTQLLSSKPIIMQDDDYWRNKFRIEVEISSSQNALGIAGNIAMSQGCIDRYNHIIQNEKYYF